MKFAPEPQDRTAVLAVGSLIGFNALIFFAIRNQSYVHVEAIRHVNMARALFDSPTPGFRQLGLAEFPLQPLLIAPFAWFNAMWTAGLAGSLVSVLCFIAAGWFVFAASLRLTGAKTAAWLAFLFFALNPRMIYLFTTPVTEPLMTMCTAGLAYFLLRWIQEESWKPLTCAALAAICGVLTDHEGWALGTASVFLVFAVARNRRVFQSLCYAGAVTIPPLLWRLYGVARHANPIVFADIPIGAGWIDSFRAYFVEIAYCVNPTILWLSLGGIAAAWVLSDRRLWRENTVFVALFAVTFIFGLWRQQSSVTTTHYSVVMAATLPTYAAILVYSVFRLAAQRRVFALVMFATLFLPDPTPGVRRESITEQFTGNLFYEEGKRSQSVWAPDIMDVADRLAGHLNSEGEVEGGNPGTILASLRIVDPVVWRTGIPMRRFINETNESLWDQNVQDIAATVRWVIAEEGDPLWIAQGQFLREHFMEMPTVVTPTTVHLYRRR